MDLGRGEVVRAPQGVRERWWEGATRQWPITAADLGMRRDTPMVLYVSNQVAVAYGDVLGERGALSQRLGFRVRLLGARWRLVQDAVVLRVT